MCGNLTPIKVLTSVFFSKNFISSEVNSSIYLPRGLYLGGGALFRQLPPSWAAPVLDYAGRSIVC